eukprot:TRINITY_DN17347_c1_g1_i1.p1 TRINITY_DN17347_c1_g1~~TRINITY_DN17347_c1_g1_i1.p1  ORF type:complete len:179 (-),score=73.22 TRINITY_DN17347_c1_g1_i1:225-761(-)
MEEFKDSPSALVADVDCTTGGKDLCEKHKVTGYPSIKWGDPNDLKDYNGGRSFDDLKTFADENLGPTCGPDNLDLCSEEEKKAIKKFMKWDLDELEIQIEEAEAKVTSVEQKAQKEVDKLEGQVSGLQKKIEKENKKKDDKIAKEKKDSNYKYLKLVQASKKPKEETKEEQVEKKEDL